MGLDIRVANAKFIDKIPDEGFPDNDGADENHGKMIHEIYNNKGQERQLGEYEGKILLEDWMNPLYKVPSFSYGGYNVWRRGFSIALLDMAPEEVWEVGDECREKGRPYPHDAYYLVDFADNEGFICPEVAAKLAKVFEDNEEKVKSWPSDKIGDGEGACPKDYLVGRYELIKKAFQIARDNNAFVLWR